MDAHIDRRGIAWEEYPFAGATVFPRGRVAWSDVRDINPDAAPPEVRTRTGETLFVAAPRKELQAHAEVAGVRVVRGPDVWGLLLEPFLDTYFDPPVIERTNARLAALGVSAQRRARVHARFGSLMLSYNIDSGLWDWTSLGLCDFLGAINGVLVPNKHLIPPVRRRVRLYRWAMAVAERARTHARAPSS